MKIKLFYKSTLILFISLFIFSCNSDNEEVVVPKKYLVDYKKVKENKKGNIQFVAGVIGSYLEGTNISFFNKINHDVETYVIKYKTTFKEKEVVASGLVMIPKGKKDFPILSFQNGTNVEHKKAPSVDYNSQFFQLFKVVASTGFIVSVPDYLGFGASKQMFHPYLHKKSTTQSMVDMLKAVRELTNGKKVDVKSNKNVYLSGYSQGGWSTMCLQKALELDYSGEFNVVASSCGAGPYNLETVIKNVLKKKTYDNPYFLAYVFNAMYKLGEINEDAIYKIVKKPYAKKMEALFDGVKAGWEINNELTSVVGDMFTDNFINNYETSDDFKDVRKFLKNNSVGFWSTKIPTKLFHGTVDNDVPFATSQEAYDEMTKLGVSNSTLQLIPIPNQSHGGAILPAEIATLEWFLELKK